MPILSSNRLLVGLQAVGLTVAALYFAQPVLMPLVTAILLTFLLRPATVALERHYVPRVLAVILVSFGVLAGVGSTGWVLTRQLHELALHLDEYRGHMRAKIERVRNSRTKAIENLRMKRRAEKSQASRVARSRHQQRPGLLRRPGSL